MNFLRTIKIKETFGELDSLSKEERFFVCLFNNTNQIELNNGVIYFTKDKRHFMYYDCRDSSVWCEYDKIWSNLAWKFNLSDNDIDNLIKNVFKKAFDIKIVKTRWSFSTV